MSDKIIAKITLIIILTTIVGVLFKVINDSYLDTNIVKSLILLIPIYFGIKMYQLTYNNSK